MLLFLLRSHRSRHPTKAIGIRMLLVFWYLLPASSFGDTAGKCTNVYWTGTAQGFARISPVCSQGSQMWSLKGLPALLKAKRWWRIGKDLGLCFRWLVFRLTLPWDYLFLLQSWFSEKMGPSNNRFFSFGVIFYFHDYLEKGYPSGN